MPPAWLWSRSGREVWFYHRPNAVEAGTWAEHLTTRHRRRVTRHWGHFSPSRRWAAQPSTRTRRGAVIDLHEGASFDVGMTGQLLFQPSETLLATTMRRPGADNPLMRPSDVEVLRLDGTERRRIGTIMGRGAVGWVDDGRIALLGRASPSTPTVLRVVDLDGHPWREWALGARVRELLLSPSGRFAVYTAILGGPGENGQFILDIDSGRRTAIAADAPASVRWMPDESGLVLAPMRRNAAGGFDFWLAPLPWRGPTVRLTAGVTPPVRMELFDWQIDPRGNALAYREERTLRLHVLRWAPTTPISS